jgi:histidine phosphotransferase ChpT
MSENPLELAGVLCSRLCHDLMSPVGAMTNALELLDGEADPAMREQALQLVADSARASIDRLKYFRLAFGWGAGGDEPIDTSEMKSVVAALVGANRRLTLGWMVEQPTMKRSVARVLLNLALIAIDALVRGGRLDIAAEGKEIVVRAEGPRIVLDAQIRAALAGEGDPISGRTSIAWLARRLAEDAHGTLGIADSEPGILLLAATLD